MTPARNIRSIAVYCGSSIGLNPAYREGAMALGRAMVERGWGLVYGGASVGLMGVIADTVLKAGGEVIGVMPRNLDDKEISHSHLTQLIRVESMHERKAKMADLSDGFVAMPGGFGTLDELFEIVTWSQLGLHQKPCGLLNVAGYYSPLVGFLDQMVREQFVRPVYRDMIMVEADASRLLDRFADYEGAPVPKWVNRETI